MLTEENIAEDLAKALDSNLDHLVAETNTADARKTTEPSIEASTVQNKPGLPASEPHTSPSIEVEKKRNFEALKEKDIYVRNDKNFVLLHVPSGKPSKTEIGKRVIQHSQKGATCFYYSLKLHAMLDPMYPKIQMEKQRLLASQYRKRITSIDYEEMEIENWVSGIKKKMGVDAIEQLMNSQSKFQSIGMLRFLVGFVKNATSKKASNQYQNFSLIEKLVNDFEKSSFTNMSEFRKIYKYVQRIDAVREFMLELKLNPEKEVFDYVNNSVETSQKAEFPVTNLKKLSSLQDVENIQPLINKSVFYTCVANRHLAQIFNLKPSAWKPTDGIDALFKVIVEMKKPMVIFGLFGESFYREPDVKSALSAGSKNQSNVLMMRKSKKVAELEHYHVYGFTKGTHKSGQIGQYSFSSHAISVIGLEKTPDKIGSQGYVYYVDPMDESEPGKPRIIYKLSYENFCNYCLDNEVRIVKEYDSAPRSNLFNYGLI